MKKNFIMGLIVGSITTIAISAIATDVYENISVVRNTINVVVNGEVLTADNFLYNDTTYVPIRAVSEALDKKVQFDNSTNTAIIEEGDDTMEQPVHSKYIPPDNIINDMIFNKDTGAYYIPWRFIHNNYLLNNKDVTCTVVETQKYEVYDFVMYKNGAEIYRTPLSTEYAMGCIPYDTFVDEILPLIE